MPSNRDWLKWRCDRCHAVTCICGLVVPTKNYDPNSTTTAHPDEAPGKNVLTEMDQALDRALDRIRTLEALRDDLYRNYDAATDRIRALEAQRDELLAALEALTAVASMSRRYTIPDTLIDNARAAIRKAREGNVNGT